MSRRALTWRVWTGICALAIVLGACMVPLMLVFLHQPWYARLPGDHMSTIKVLEAAWVSAWGLCWLLGMLVLLTGQGLIWLLERFDR